MTKVLIVDDTPVERKVLSALLARVGCETLTAGDAATARRVFAESEPGLVLTDLHLSGEDGLALARSLRSAFGGRKFRVVLMSGDVPGENAGDPAVDAFLQKPIALRDLTSYLEENA